MLIERLGLLVVRSTRSARADCSWPLLLDERLTEPVRHLHRLVDESHERWLLAKDFLDLLKVRPALRPVSQRFDPNRGTVYGPEQGGSV